MQATEPAQATAETLRHLIPLARSPYLFLSAYLPTDRDDPTMEGLRLRLAARLEEIAQELADTGWEKPFLEERGIVERFVRSLRPGGPVLAIISSLQAQKWTALWLPDRLAVEHVRFGRGAYVLPLLDVLDEWEPVGLVEVHRDKGRVMVFSSGHIEESQHFEAEVPGKHKAGGGTAAHYQRGSMGPEAQHMAGGGAAARYQRHIEAHVEQHLKQVAQGIEDAHRRFNFRRLFLAGPPEAVATFKPHLSYDLKGHLVGELSISPRATDAEVYAQVMGPAREVERREEFGLVQEVITRAEKGQGAVAGMAPTLWALNEGRVYLLVLAADLDQPGRYCRGCDLALPVESIICPRCDRRTVKVNLWKELPGIALAQGVLLEVVHDAAASEIWAYDDIGALLKPAADR